VPEGFRPSKVRARLRLRLRLRLRVRVRLSVRVRAPVTEGFRPPKAAKYPSLP